MLKHIAEVFDSRENLDGRLRRADRAEFVGLDWCEAHQQEDDARDQTQRQETVHDDHEGLESILGVGVRW